MNKQYLNRKTKLEKDEYWYKLKPDRNMQYELSLEKDENFDVLMVWKDKRIGYNITTIKIHNDKQNQIESFPYRLGAGLKKQFVELYSDMLKEEIRIVNGQKKLREQYIMERYNWINKKIFYLRGEYCSECKTDQIWEFSAYYTEFDILSAVYFRELSWNDKHPKPLVFKKLIPSLKIKHLLIETQFGTIYSDPITNYISSIIKPTSPHWLKPWDTAMLTSGVSHIRSGEQFFNHDRNCQSYRDEFCPFSLYDFDIFHKVNFLKYDYIQHRDLLLVFPEIELAKSIVLDSVNNISTIDRDKLPNLIQTINETEIVNRNNFVENLFLALYIRVADERNKNKIPLQTLESLKEEFSSVSESKYNIEVLCDKELLILYYLAVKKCYLEDVDIKNNIHMMISEGYGENKKDTTQYAVCSIYFPHPLLNPVEIEDDWFAEDLYGSCPHDDLIEKKLLPENLLVGSNLSIKGVCGYAIDDLDRKPSYDGYFLFLNNLMREELQKHYTICDCDSETNLIYDPKELILLLPHKIDNNLHTPYCESNFE